MPLLSEKETTVIFANIEDILISSTIMLSELGQSSSLHPPLP